MTRGYFAQPEATREMRTFGWHHTGDVGYLDDRGYLYIVDRLKDMIISGGFNVYAEDLEKVLLKDDDVVDAAVIAVPSEQWGETPLGLVVLREGAEGDLEAIRERANQQLGKGQRLSGLERRDELPRSTIGKILKRELRDPYWKDLEQSKRD